MLIGIGKNKGIPMNQRVRAKIRDKKNVHPTSRKPEKAAWAKKVSRWTENPKGRSRQKLGI